MGSVQESITPFPASGGLRRHVLAYGSANGLLDALMDARPAEAPTGLEFSIAPDMKAARRILASVPIAAILCDLTGLQPLHPVIAPDIQELARQAPVIALIAAPPSPVVLDALEHHQINPLPAPHLTPYMLTWMMEHMIRRREAEQALAEQTREMGALQTQYQAVLSGTPNGLCVLRPGWRIEWANHSLAMMVNPGGMETSDLIGMKLGELFPSEAAFEDFEESVLDQLQETGGAMREVILQRLDGGLFYAELSLVRLHPEDEGSGVVATIVDATSHHDIGQQLQRQQEFENLIARLSLQFIESGLEDEGKAMSAALMQIGTFFKVDRCYILESLDDMQHVIQPHIWRHSGVPVFQQGQNCFPVGHLAFAQERLKTGRDLFFQELDELPDEAEAERGFFRKVGVRSLAAIPLTMGRAFQGILCLDTVFEPHVWTTETMSLLKVVARVLLGALDRNRWEKRLRLSEERFALIFDMAPLPIGISRLSDGVYLTVNQSFLDEMGFRRDQVIGHSAVELGLWASPEDRARVIEKFQREGHIHGETFSINTATGERRTVMLFMEPLDLEGESCLLTIAQDVTSLMETQAALQESEAQMRAIVQAIPDTILITDKDGTYLKAYEPDPNRAPIPPDQVTGKSHRDVLPPDVSHAYEAVMRKALETHTLQITYFDIHTGGIDRTFESRITPLGQNRLLKLLRDVTNERRMQDQIVEQERMAAIGQTMAMVSHCMKNIFTALNGSLVLLRRAIEIGDHERINHSRELLQKSVSRLYLLFMEMLDFSKRREPHPQLMEIRPLLTEVQDALEIGRHDQIELEIDDGNCLITVNLDREWMYRILMNLGQNAIDAMPRGGLLQMKVRVLEKPLPPGAAHELITPEFELVIEVSDTGVGIAPEHLPNLFKPLFSTKGSRGTGLGLASVRDLVELQGGRIDVTSRVGQGTTFRLIFPSDTILGYTPLTQQS